MSTSSTMPEKGRKSAGLPTAVIVIALVVVVVILGVIAFRTLGPAPEVVVHKDPVALIRRGQTDPGSLTPHERQEYEKLTHGAPLGGMRGGMRGKGRPVQPGLSTAPPHAAL